MKQVAGIHIAGVWDINREVMVQAAEDAGVPYFQDEAEIFDRTDALVIASPTLSHLEWALRAAEARKHLFIEKPVTATMRECKRLEAALAGKHLICQVGHVERFNPAFLAVRDQVKKPLFIEGHRLAEFKPRGTDVSVVMDLMIHDIDLVLSLVREPVRDIRANGVAVMSPTPDICNARIEFESGTVANLTASRISMKQMRKLRIFQADAYIGMDLLKKESQVVKIQGEMQEGHPLSFPVDTGNGTRYIQVDMPEPKANNAITDELSAFAQSILYHAPVAVPFKDGQRALQVAEDILTRIEEQAARIAGA